MTEEKEAPVTSNLPIKVTFHFKISGLATLQFKESRKKTKREMIYVAVKK